MQIVRILIADDDPLIRLDLKTMLKSIGFSVIGEAENGEQAFRMAQTFKPDLLILDVNMPVWDGIQAAQAISRERIAPVILLTAYSDTPLIEKAIQAGVVGFLVKPFREIEMLPAITVGMARYKEMLALEGALQYMQQEKEVEQIVAKAQKILMNRDCLTEREADRRMQAIRLSTGKSLQAISEAIILTEEMSLGTKKNNNPS